MENPETTSTPVESTPPPEATAAPVEQPRQPNVYGETPSGHSDHVRALQGQTNTLLKEAQQAAKPDAKIDEPPPGQRFGLSEKRKQQLAAELKAQKTGQPVAVAAAPAKAPVTKPPVDAVKFVGNYFDADDADPGDLLGRLYDTDYDRYERLVEHVIANNRDHALRLLGVNTGPHPNDAEFSHLSDERHRLAAIGLPPNVWESLSLADPREQVFHLEREAQRMDAEQRDLEERATYVVHLQRQGLESLEKLSGTYEKEIRATLKDFMPFDVPADNTAFHNFALNFVSSELLQYPEYAEMKQRIEEAARVAPFLRAIGKTVDAERARRTAETLAKQFGAEFKALLKGYVGPVADAFRKAKLYDELMKAQEAGEQQPTPNYVGTPIPGQRFGLTYQQK